MKYTFTRKQIVNAFNNKILDDDNFLTYLLSTTSKDISMNQKSLYKKKPKELKWIKDWKQLNPNWTEVQISFIGSLLQDLEEEIRVQQRTELLEGILNLECLKEEKITKNIFSITQLESRNKLRNEIKEEIKNYE